MGSRRRSEMEDENSAGVGESGSSNFDGDSSGESGSGEGQDRLSKIEQMVEQLANSVEGTQKVIGRFGNEMGPVRDLISQLNSSNGQNQNGENDNAMIKSFMEDPQGTIAKVARESQTREAQERVQRQNQVLESVMEMAPDFEEHRADVLEAIAKDTQKPMSYVEQNFLEGGPGIAYNVLMRVKAEKELAELQKTMENLKRMGTDIEGAKAFQRGASNGETASTSTQDPLEGMDFRDMSDDQLKDLYSKTIKKQRR